MPALLLMGFIGYGGFTNNIARADAVPPPSPSPGFTGTMFMQ
jgi:hypothetical protein